MLFTWNSATQQPIWELVVIMVCCLGSDLNTSHLTKSQIHQQLHGFTFPTSFSPWSPSTFWFPVAPLFHLSLRKPGLYLPHSAACFLRCTLVQGQRRREAHTHPAVAKVFVPCSLRHYSRVWNACGILQPVCNRMEKREKKKKKTEDFSSLPLFLGNPSATPQGEPERFPLNSLCALHQFWIPGFPEPGKGLPGEKNVNSFPLMLREWVGAKGPPVAEKGNRLPSDVRALGPMALLEK